MKRNDEAIGHRYYNIRHCCLLRAGLNVRTAYGVYTSGYQRLIKDDGSDSFYQYTCCPMKVLSLSFALTLIRLATARAVGVETSTL